MNVQSHGHEHELEPQYGLPERLPAGERLLWQGSPDFAATALRVFHLRKAALYFAALLALRASVVMADGGSLWEALAALPLPAALAALALAALATLAWLTARTAVYTLTDRRLVMRIGIVLTLSFNIPLKSIRAAALRRVGGAREAGDIVIALAGPDRIAFGHLWPHVRPWRLAQPEPMLRAVAHAPQVAQQLVQAWSAATGVAVHPAAPQLAPQTTPQTTPQWQPSPT
jgi:Bacterial PH domain